MLACKPEITVVKETNNFDFTNNIEVASNHFPLPNACDRMLFDFEATLSFSASVKTMSHILNAHNLQVLAFREFRRGQTDKAHLPTSEINLATNNTCIEIGSCVSSKLRYARLDQCVALFREPSDGSYMSISRAAGSRSTHRHHLHTL